MDVRDAIYKADQILDQERMEPTVRYVSTSSDRVIAAFAAMPTFGPLSERGKHPRTIQEQPTDFQLKSTNFELLCSVWEQVAENGRAALTSALCARISDGSSFRHTSTQVLGSGTWSRCSSELPLIAEFVARQGDQRTLLRSLSKAAPSPGLTLLLLQIEEMIALNFRVFSEGDYAALPHSLISIESGVADLNTRPKPASTRESNVVYHITREIPEVCRFISDACRKARYLYLKGELLLGMNLEVNQDKNSVRTFLEKLGFTPLLIQSLDEAEKLYRSANSPFEFKSSMGHLRSFLEQLHVQACALGHRRFGGQLPSKWGEAHQYLRDNDILTVKEQQFVIHFYTLMSDTSVHPLAAEREYARLMRNMSIEYGLLLLTKLDKAGLK